MLFYHNANYASSVRELLGRFTKDTVLYRNVFIIAWIFRGLILLLLLLKYSTVKSRFNKLYDCVFPYFNIIKEIDYAVALLLLLV